MKLHNALKNIALPSLFLWSFCVAIVQAEAAPVNVTALNYVEAKTAIQFDKYLASAGGKLNSFAQKVIFFDTATNCTTT